MEKSTLILSMSLLAGTLVSVFPKLTDEVSHDQHNAQNNRTVLTRSQMACAHQDDDRRRTGRRSRQRWSPKRAETLLTTLQNLSAAESYGLFHGKETLPHEFAELHLRDIAHILDHHETIHDLYVRDLLLVFAIQHYQFETCRWLKSLPNLDDRITIQQLLNRSKKDFNQSTTQELSEWLFDEQEIDIRTRAGRLSSFSAGFAFPFPVTPHLSELSHVKSPINLKFAPEVIHFENFINYGEPINRRETEYNGNPTNVVITESRIEMPVFHNPTKHALRQAQKLLLKENSPQWLHELIEHEIAQLRESLNQP